MTLSGGIMGMNEQSPTMNGTFINVPVALDLEYDVSATLALAGSVTWFIPTTKSVELGDGSSLDQKSPDIFAYMGNINLRLPLESGSVSPYLTGGAGGIIFLKATDAGRYPKLAESQTMFGADFGGSVSHAVDEIWAVRADVREFMGLPQKDSQGFDDDGNSANPIWMTRGTLGLSFTF